MAYLIDVGNPAVSFGVGPQLTAPTASKAALGTEKWSAGVVNTLFDARSKRFQYGVGEVAGVRRLQHAAQVSEGERTS